jgi:ubiquinone/menaquinone biosynthesis C-methylase UbiE
MQEEQSLMNKIAWNTKAYQAWIRLYGSPAEIAKAMKENPESFLKRYLVHMGDVKGKRIINLCGSHGRRAIPLALMGGEVTIIDISKENKKFAEEVAREAGTEFQYINADIMKIPYQMKLKDFDIALMEFGVLHYFADLNKLFEIVASLLRSGGSFVLTDFHPFTKTISGGNYFDSSFIEGKIAYHDFLPEDEQNELKNVLLRKWTMGEIISSIANSGLFIRKLIEEPRKDNKCFPSNFTLDSDKITSTPDPIN